MKHIQLILIIGMISNFVNAQDTFDSTTSKSLRSIFNQISIVDSLIATGELAFTHGDGDWGYSDDYYFNDQTIKSTSTTFYNLGLFTEEYYPNIYDGNSVTIFAFIKDGILNFELYLIRINETYLELLIKGKKEDFVDIIEKHKSSNKP